MRARLRFREAPGKSSPRGSVVMVFPDKDRAENARQALIRNGFSEEAITRYGNQAAKEPDECEQHVSDPVQSDQEVAKVDVYLDSADEGFGFLVVRAPKSEEMQTAVDIADHYGLTRAEKYNRLTLEQVA